MSWLDPSKIKATSRELIDPEGTEEDYWREVFLAKEKLGEDDRFVAVVDIYNQEFTIAGRSFYDGLSYTEEFFKIFRRALIPLNKGVEPLDVIRECVRRTFSVSQLVPFGDEGSKMSRITDELINNVAKKILELEYTIYDKE